MTIETIIYPTLMIGVLGAFFAIVLSVVSKKFAVPRDERVEALGQILPGLNCGGCGFPNCMAYAENLLAVTDISTSLCKPGGEETAQAVASFVGRDASVQEKTIAFVRCRGGKQHAHDEFSYSGVYSCRAAHVVRGGFKLCKQGCLGFGDCFSACTFDAIYMGERGLPVIDREKCVSCGACVSACPRHIIQLVPQKARVLVECVNTDKGAQTTKACDVGCIGCRLCEKACPCTAIMVINNVAVVDYTKCINCGKCVTVCPRGIILQLPPLPSQ